MALYLYAQASYSVHCRKIKNYEIYVVFTFSKDMVRLLQEFRAETFYFQCFPKVPIADGFYRLLDIWLSATLIEGSLLSIRLFEFRKSDNRLRSYIHLKICNASHANASQILHFM